MLIINDNLGVIIDEGYFNCQFLIRDGSLGDYALKERDKILKGSRKIEETEIYNDQDVTKEPKMAYSDIRVYCNGDPYNINVHGKLPCLFDEYYQMWYPVLASFPEHAKEEARLSLKIAKLNVAVDSKNKYYQQEFEKAEKEFEKFKN